MSIVIIETENSILVNTKFIWTIRKDRAGYKHCIVANLGYVDVENDGPEPHDIMLYSNENFNRVNLVYQKIKRKIEIGIRNISIPDIEKEMRGV